MKYYAVKNGRQNGIYTSWTECEKQVNGFSNAQYKSFSNLKEAKAYLGITKKENNQAPLCRIYIDGSFSRSKNMYSYGMVVLYEGKELHFKEAFNDASVALHNVAGELKGAMKAFDYCLTNHIEHVELYYDYMGIEKWATGAWKANKKTTKEYQNYYYQIAEKLDVNFIKVKSHSNNHYNELADQLAKEALESIPL